MVTLRIVFVLSPYQNVFFDELADALGLALDDIGVERCLTVAPGEHVVRDDDVFVLLPPHEYVALEGDGFLRDSAVALRTIGISAEQPHQSFFERNAAVGAELGAVLDFSARSVAAFQRLGVDARHLRFGHVPSWDRMAERRNARAIETPVLYLGNPRPRRLSTLASAAEELSLACARLVVSDPGEPNRVNGPSFFTGAAKRELLASTGLLVNIHQSDEPYFEWLRFVEAAHCGVPVLTERSTDTEPFEDGVHFLSFERSELSGVLAAVRSEQRRLDDVAAAAHARLVETPLSDSIGTLVEVASALLVRPPPTALPARTRSEPIGRNRSIANEFPILTSPMIRHRVADGFRSLWRRTGSYSADSSFVVVAPLGTSWRRPPDDLVAEAGGPVLLNVMADGLDAKGTAMLEGIRPWEPWRLWFGEHLGRVLLVDPWIVRAAEGWLDDADFDAVPHLRIQLYAAVHGIEGAHLPCPHASLAVSVDASHRIDTSLAARCRKILGQSG